MIVLGFDTATPATAVGLRLAGGETLEGRDDPSVGRRPGHSTQLLPIAHELLERAQLHWQDIERIGVGTGPGTFTGLRIGVATARGLAQSLGVDLVGVSSLRALACSARDRADGVLAVIDARRGEAFVAAYRGAQELVPPQALPPERLHEVLGRARAQSDRANNGHVDDPSGEAAGAGTGREEGQRRDDWIAVGDGALRFAGHLQDMGVTVPPADSGLHAVSGRSLCELALDAQVSGRDVVPYYGRLPDAELALEGSPS